MENNTETTKTEIEINEQTETTAVATSKHCTGCGATLEEGQMFCGKCGQSVQAVVDQTTTEAIQKFNAEVQNKGKKKKKALLITLISVAATAVIAVAAIFLVPLIQLAVGNSAFDAQDYATAVQYYEQSGKSAEEDVADKYHYAVAMTYVAEGDFETAAEWFEKANKLLNAEDEIFVCGEKLIEKQEYQSAIYCFNRLDTEQASAYVTYCEGMIAYRGKEYTTAIEKMLAVKSTVTAAADVMPELYYAYGESLFQQKEYVKASQQFKNAGNYEDAKNQIDICTIMHAETLFNEGRLNDAQKVFKTLPSTFTYGNISVTKRLKALEDAEKFLKICGEWDVTKNYIESRNIYKRTGSWDSWYYDTIQWGQNLKVYCILNNDGTVTLKGSVTFYRFTNYSSLSAYCTASLTTKYFTVYNVKSIPKTIEVDGTTTLTFSNNRFSLTYTQYDYYSAYFYNRYRTTATFGTRDTAY